MRTVGAVLHEQVRLRGDAATTTAAFGPHTIKVVKSTTWQTVSDESLPATGIVILVTDAARESPSKTARAIGCAPLTLGMAVAMTIRPATEMTAT